ncbi:MAG: hypothetical protein R3A10_15910 [Caldilineaceae bacterium]
MTAALRVLLDAARDGSLPAGTFPLAGNLAGAPAAALEERHAPVAAPGHQCHGRDRAHEFRPPLERAARRAVDRVSQGATATWSTRWTRAPRRHDHARARSRALTGAEDAMVVISRAAVYLTLAALCTGRVCPPKPGTTGGDRRRFSHPRRSVLAEAGWSKWAPPTAPTSAMKAHASGDGRAMRIHSSNFRQLGFVAQPTLAETAAVAQARTGTAHRQLHRRPGQRHVAGDGALRPAPGSMVQRVSPPGPTSSPSAATNCWADPRPV